MKNFAPMLALLAFLPVANPAYAATPPSPPRTGRAASHRKIKYNNPARPTVYIDATGICGPQPTLTRESAAEGDTLVMAYTLHATPCEPHQTPYHKSVSQAVDLIEEARAVGITAEKPKLKATVKVVYN